MFTGRLENFHVAGSKTTLGDMRNDFARMRRLSVEGREKLNAKGENFRYDFVCSMENECD